MSRGGQSFRVLQSAVDDLRLHKLARRNVEAEAMAAWRAVDTLTTAEPRDWRENIGALVEMQERIERMIEGAAK